LAQIPIIPEGGRLQQGAVYLDLRNAASGPFAATGDMIAHKHNIYVAKNKTPYQYWNRLVGVFCPRPAGGASTGQNAGAGSELSEELVDKTLQDSFPASDPPSWTTGRDPEKQKP